MTKLSKEQQKQAQSPQLSAKLSSQPPSPYVSSTTTTNTVADNGTSVKRMHSLTNSLKGLFVKSPKQKPVSPSPGTLTPAIITESSDQLISPLHSATSPRSAGPSGHPSPALSARSNNNLGSAPLKKPGLPTIYTSEESTLTACNDIGFIPLNSMQDENGGSTSPASKSRSSSKNTSRSNSKMGTRISSHDTLSTVPNTSASAMLTAPPPSSSTAPAVLSPSHSINSSSNVNKKIAVQELGITIFEDGTHEHHLTAIKALEKLPSGTGGGILSGFLRKNSSAATALAAADAFSLLPEKNRLDFQKRLSMQSSRRTSSSLDDDDEDDSSEGDSILSEDDNFEYTACIGDNQLDLINKLKEKISKNEDPSLRCSRNYKLIEKYGKAQGVVGKGAYGLVKLVSRVDPDSKAELFYAVKELKQKDSEDIEHFSNRLTSEFVISNSLKHINIVRTIDLMKTSTGIYSEIMEYCSAGDLYTLISKSNQEGLHYMTSDCFFKQILNGIHFMHTAGVAHCDLKPENVLLTSTGIAKISDFGTAAVFRASWEKKIHLSTGACGSEPYVSPEEFTKGAEYDPRLVDVWSLGIMYLTMMTGSYAWRIAKVKEDDLYEQYLTDRPRVDKSGSFPAIESLIGGPNTRSRIHNIYQMLDPDPNSRITTGRLLQSKWVKEIGLCDAVAGEYEFHQHLKV